jgi:hypothetical protein
MPMQAQRKDEGILPTHSQPGTRRRWVVRTTTPAALPPGRARYLLLDVLYLRYLIEISIYCLHNNALLHYIIITRLNAITVNDLLIRHVSPFTGRLQVTVKRNKVLVTYCTYTVPLVMWCVQ